MRRTILALLLAATATAQPKQYIAPPWNAWPDSAVKRAATLYQMAWATTLKDTTALVYLKQSLWFHRDTIELKFTIDTIVNRGDRRRVALRREEYLNGARIDTLTRIDTLGYLRKELDPFFGLVWRADSISPGIQSRTWQGSRLQVSLDKVIGDPEVYGGRNQRAQLRFAWRQQIPVIWRNYIDTLTTGF